MRSGEDGSHPVRQGRGPANSATTFQSISFSPEPHNSKRALMAGDKRISNAGQREATVRQANSGQSLQTSTATTTLP